MNILKFSNQILIYTFSFLERKDLENCLLTCKRFRGCTYQNLGKEIFRSLSTRTVDKFIKGPYLGLIRDYVMPIGLRLEKFEDIQIFLDSLKDIEQKVKVWRIAMMSSLTHENFLQIFSLSKELAVFEAFIEDFNSLNYLLEMVKSVKTKVILSVKTSGVERQPFEESLVLWKHALKELPESIQLYGIDCSQYVVQFQSTVLAIVDICKDLKVKSLSLGGVCGIELDLSNCEFLIDVKTKGVYGIVSDLLLPKGLKSLAISAYVGVWTGIDGRNCKELKMLDLTGAYGGIIYLLKSLENTIKIILEKKEDAMQIEWV